jgi:hypothetical protein
MHLTANTRHVGGVTIVDISGRIVLGAESAALRSLVCDLLTKGHKKIVLNLEDVNFIVRNLCDVCRSASKRAARIGPIDGTCRSNFVASCLRLSASNSRRTCWCKSRSASSCW